MVTWWGESTRHPSRSCKLCDRRAGTPVPTPLFPANPTNQPSNHPTSQPTIDRSIDRPIDGSISDGIADGSRDRASLRSPHWVVLMDRYLRGRCTLKECAPIAGRSSRDQIYLAAPRHASPSARSFVISRSTPGFLLADLFRGGDFFLWSPLLLFTRGSRNFFDGIEINFSFSFF